MKKIALFVPALILALCVTGCSGKSGSIPDIATISGLVTEKGYTEEDILKELSGQSNASLAEAWGAPDGMLSGFWGDIWNLSEYTGRHIIVYYDSDGVVDYVIIAENNK